MHRQRRPRPEKGHDKKKKISCLIFPEDCDRKLQEEDDAEKMGVTEIVRAQESSGEQTQDTDNNQCNPKPVFLDHAATLLHRTALAIPATQAAGEYAAIRSLAFSPRRRAETGSRASCSITAASCPISRGRTSRPVSPSLIKSLVQPATLLQITGNPHDIASLTTSPHGSVCVGKTKISASP